MRTHPTWIGLLALALSYPADLTAQAGIEIEVYPAFVAEADGSRLTPGRIELEERTIYPGDSVEIDSYTYVTVDGHHSWGERQLVIDWVALTWNGTGFDRNVVAQRGLDLRSRVTPRGVPLGLLAESHYHPGGSTVARANPDGVLERLPHANPQDLPVYNEIVSPYLLATLDLAPGMQFIVPDFTPYRASAPLRYRLFTVRDQIDVYDEMGHVHRALRVDAVTAQTLEDARALVNTSPERYVSYYVSPSAPHFLGKRWIGWRDGNGATGTKEWRLVVHEALSVPMSDRLDEILEVRARRARAQELPWGDSVVTGRPNGGGR